MKLSSISSRQFVKKISEKIILKNREFLKWFILNSKLIKIFTLENFFRLKRLYKHNLLFTVNLNFDKIKMTPQKINTNSFYLFNFFRSISFLILSKSIWDWISLFCRCMLFIFCSRLPKFVQYI